MFAFTSKELELVESQKPKRGADPSSTFDFQTFDLRLFPPRKTSAASATPRFASSKPFKVQC